MNAPFSIAQVIPATNTPTPPKIVKVTRPADGQAITIQMDGAVKLDLTAIGSEKITLVRVGERLTILFENKSTVTIEPFFDGNGQPLQSGGIDLDGNRTVTSEQFATIFPITDDQSVLPAAGDAAAPRNTGGPFATFTIQELAGNTPLGLLDGEDSPAAFQSEFQQQSLDDEVIPPSAGGFTLVLDDEGAGDGSPNFGDELNGDDVDPSDAESTPEHIGSGVLPHSFGNGGAGTITFAAMDGTSQTIDGITYGFAWDAATGTLTISVGDTPMVTVVLNQATGEFTATLVNPLTHAPGEGENNLQIALTYTVTNGDGLTASGTLTLDIDDDTPEIGQQSEEGGSENPLPALLSEVDESDLSNGQTGTDQISGLLNIRWGADNSNVLGNVGVGADGPVAGDRAVAFAPGLNAPEGLTSNGVGIQYEITGTLLTAYRVDAQGHYIGADGQSLGESPSSGAAVFTVSLSDLDSGSFTFTLIDNLDHAESNDELLDLDFSFVAYDSDGDPVQGNFTVSVGDDGPSIGTPQSRTVDEDGLDGGNVEPAGQNGDVPHAATSRTGSLDITWGADSNNSAVDNGSSVQFDRSVTFANVVDGADVLRANGQPLMSEGEVVVFHVIDGNTIEGVVPGEGESADRPVFRITLSDEGNGSYTFELLDNVDHPDNGLNNENNIRLEFDFTATDSDGDSADGTFVVRIDDDAPIQNANEERSRVDEDDLNNYQPIAHALGWPIEGSHGTSPDGDTAWHGGTATEGSVANLVSFGADSAGSGFSFAFDTDAAASDAIEALGLSSKGDDIDTARLLGDWLVAGTDDRIVFALKLESDGSYRFVLFDQLDHPRGDRPNTEALEAIEDRIEIDFSSFIQATDGDGDSIILDADSFVIRVRDDIPEVVGQEHHSVNENDLASFNPAYPILFDFWQGSLGTSPNDGSGDGSVTGLFGTVPVWGTLADNIKGGADERGEFHLVSESRAEDLLATLGGDSYLTSKGQDINDARFVHIDGIGEVMGFFAEDGRLIFGLYLSENGLYNFRLFDQLDHPLGDDPSTDAAEAYADDIDIDFSEFVTYTDYDGDAIDLGQDTFVITVKDDVPVVVGTEHHTVNENDLANFNPLYPAIFDFWQGSIGTSPYDGGTDDSITGLLGTVPVWGLLSDNVVGGADEFGHFNLVTEARAELLLASAGGTEDAPAFLTSKGEAINDARMITIDGLGDVMGFFAADGRLVFGLFVTEAGVYNFRLFDQLDHPLGDDPNTDIPEAFADTIEIDLSQFVTYTDRDGDTIDLGDGTFVIAVTDDIPQVIGSVTVTLDESDLANYNPLWTPLWSLIPWTSIQGSAGSSPDSDTDPLVGTTSQQGFLNEIIGNNDVVAGGADEAGKFGLVSETRAEALLDGMDLHSKGAAIDDVKLLDLGALGTVMGFFADGRLVFSLTLNALGAYDLRLYDQLDHLEGDGESLTIDLSQFVTFTDADGDMIDLGEGNFVLTVIDDTPVESGETVTVTVEEEHRPIANAGDFPELGHGNEDYDDTNGLDSDAAIDLPFPLPDIPVYINTLHSASGNLKPLVTGADENGAFSANEAVSGQVMTAGPSPEGVTSKGQPVLLDYAGGIVVGFVDANGDNAFGEGDHKIFTLEVQANGNFTFTLYDQIDHQPGDNIEDILTLNLASAVTYTDEDGDPIDLTSGLNIQVIDDIPISSGNVTASTKLDDEAQGEFTPVNNTPADGVANVKVATGGAKALFSIGADDGGSITITSLPAFSVVYKDANGFAQTESITWGTPSVASDGSVTVTASSDNYVPAAVLTINIDGSYSFTLNAPVAHSTNQAAEEDLPLVFGYTVSDNDQDTVSGTLKINVNDDRPVVPVAAVVASTLDDEAQSVFTPTNTGTALGDISPDVKSVSGEAGSLFTAGADGVKSVSMTSGDFNVVFKAADGFALTETATWQAASTGADGATTWIATSAHYGADNPAAVLVIKADGSYTFTANAPIAHSNTGLQEDNKALSFDYTVTDGDGDTRNNTLHVRINDDAPVVPVTAVSSLTVLDDEAQSVFTPANTADVLGDVSPNVNSASGDAGSLFTAGADGVKSVSMTSANFNVIYKTADGFALIETAIWQAASTSADGTTTWLATSAHYDAENPAAVLVIKADGSYTFTANAPIAHGTAGAIEENQQLSFAYTVTDGDGDKKDNTLKIKINDDAPLSTGAVTALPTLDDDAFTGGNADGSGDVPNATTLSGGAGALFTAGADGVKSVALGATTAFKAIYIDADGVPHQESVSWGTPTTAAGGVTTWNAIGGVTGAMVATLTINADGSYSFTTFKPLVHGTSGATEENLALTFNYTVTDGDNDTATGSLTVNVNDDTPLAGYAGRTTLQEDRDSDGDFIEQSATGVMSFKGGADGATITSLNYDLFSGGVYKVGDGDAEGWITYALTSGGEPITVSQAAGANGPMLVGKLGDGTVIFEVEVTNPATGAFKFTQYGPIDHPDNSNTGADDVLRMKVSFTVTDGDGDTATGHVQLDIRDDGPVVGDNTTPALIEEGAGTVTTGQQAFLVDWGADNANAGGANDRSLTLSTAVGFAGSSAMTALKSNGADVLFAVIGGVLVGYTGATPGDLSAANIVFTVTPSDGSGSYVFDLRQPLDHPAPNASNEHYIDLTFAVTATDSDGDSDSGTFVVRVDAAGTISSINYSALTSGVFVNLADANSTQLGQTVAANTATDRTSVTDDVVGIDQLGNIVDAYGSRAADILVGGDEANKLYGNAGADLLVGGKGNDTIDGGADDDTIVLGADITDAGAYGPRDMRLGNGSTISLSLAGLAGTGDAIYGGSGHDKVVLNAEGSSGFVLDAYYPGSPAFSGIEEIVGTSGNDIILMKESYLSDATNGGVKIDGGGGHDYLGGGAGNDEILGGTGNDVISGLGGDDLLKGGDGTDEIWGGAGNDKIYGDNGNDTLYGGDGADYLSGGGGADKMFGDAGNDTLYGSDGNDEMHGGADNDQLHGEGGSDTIFGDDGNDTVYGGDNDDVIDGGAGNDQLYGQNGNDTISGGTGNDKIGGGDGDDLILYRVGDGNDTIDGGAGTDKLSVTNAGGATVFNIGQVLGGSQIVPTTGPNGIDVALNYGATTVRMDGIEEIDLELGDGGDTVNIGTLAGTTIATSTITIEGGDGNDKVLATGIDAANPVSVNVDAGRGNDEIRTGAGDDRLVGGSGEDRLDGGAGDDVMVGGADNDLFFANGGSDTIYGNGEDLSDVANNVLAKAGEADTVVYYGDQSTFQISHEADGHWSVHNTSTGETDHLYGIEGINFNGGPVELNLLAPVQLFDANNHLLGTYDTIQAAVDAAGPVTGAVTILAGPGNYAENVVIDRGDLTLMSTGGRDETTITGIPGAGQLGTITVLGGLDNVSIGKGADSGFKIVGFDNGDPGIENAAVYVKGSTTDDPMTNFQLIGNEVQANGDLGLVSEWNAAINGATITNNIFSGKTFTGSHPGIGDQFSVPNVPRQLVAFGQGSDPTTNPATGVIFANNEITGTAGGVTTGGQESGNSLVTIDAANSEVRDNLFTGFTNADGYALRVRGPGTDVIDNTVDHDVNQSDSRGFLVINHGQPGTYSDNEIDGAGAAEILFGTPGDDLITGDNAADIIFGGAGNDEILGGGGADTMYGEAGNDLIRASSGDDELHGGDGNDQLHGEGGNDTLYGDDGNDTLYGGENNDKLFGGAGNDQVHGQDGSDELTGGAGNDNITGGSGDDVIFYNPGNGTSVVGDGSDTIDGGSHVSGDRLKINRLTSEQNTYTVRASGAGFKLDIDNFSGGAPEASLTVKDVEKLDIELKGNEWAVLKDNLSAQGVGEVAVDGDDDGQTLNVISLSGTTAVSADLNGGDDSFYGGSHATGVNVDGGAGTDSAYYFSTTTAITVDLDAGTAQRGAVTDTIQNFENFTGSTAGDTIKGSSVANVLSGDSGDDAIEGRGGDDTIIGGSGHDTGVFAGEFSTFTITFDETAETITVKDNDPTANGNEGTDTLSGVESLAFANGVTVHIVDQSGKFGEFTTIQAAVDAADANDVILVRGGNYAEQVQVEGSGKDGLTIMAATGETVTVTPPASLEKTADSPTTGRDLVSLISVEGADNVTIKGIMVDGQQRGGDLSDAPDNGTLVGISYLNSDGGVIDGVTVTGIRESDSMFGMQRGVGIYVLNIDPDGGAPTPGASADLNSIEIKNSTIVDFQKGGIAVANADVDIHDNTITGIGATDWTAQNGIQVSGSTGSITGNTVTGIGYTGSVSGSTDILTFNNRDLIIDGNHLFGTGTGHSGIGIAVIDSVGAHVTNNDLHDLGWAIDVQDYAGSWTDPLLPGSGTVFVGNTFFSIGDEFLYFSPNAATTAPFYVTGTSGYDVIYGGAGNDQLWGDEGNDTVTGGSGNDEIYGGSGDDTIIYNPGNEAGIAGDGSDSIDGGEGSETALGDTLKINRLAAEQNRYDVNATAAGFDVVINNYTGPAGATLTVANVENLDIELKGNEQLVVSGNHAQLRAVEVEGDNGSQTLTLYGLTSNTKVTADLKGGNDAFDGGAHLTGANVDGGDGIDTVNYSVISGPVTIDLANNKAVRNGGAVVDTITNFENATGSQGNDTIIGTNGVNVLRGAQGDDILVGGAGNDTLEGNEGTDTVDYSLDDGTHGVFVNLDGLTSSWYNFESVVQQVAGSSAKDTHGDLDTLTGIEKVIGTDHADVLLGSSGNDHFVGNDGNDTIIGNHGNDELHGGAGNDVIDGGSGADLIYGDAGNDTLSGGNEADLLDGGADNDTLRGGGGDDTITGGSGTDTAVYTGNFSDFTMSFSGNNVQVKDNVSAGGDHGTDTVTGVEKFTFDNTTVLIVDGPGGTTNYDGAFATIADALAAAGGISGHVTIMIAPGTYNENVVIGRDNVTLQSFTGAASDVVIEGNFETVNSITGSVADFLQTAPSYSGGGTGLTVDGSNVTIKNITFDSFNTGIALGDGADNVMLDGVDITDSVFGIHKAGDAAVTNLDIVGGTISDSYIGVYLEKYNSGGDATDVTIDGTDFIHLTQKGIYAETLQGTTVFDNIVMNDVGQYGGGVAFGAQGKNGNGIDLNLKYGTYTGSITIENFDFDDVGLSSGLGSSHANAAAIAIKTRDDAPSYSGNAASFVGLILIQDGSIDGTSTGIRAGEAGKNNAGPAVTVSDVTITDTASGVHGAVDNVTQALFTIDLTDASEIFIPAPTSTGSFNVNGEGGSDTIHGGSNDDTLSGGAGDDTFVYDVNEGSDIADGGADNDLMIVNGSGADETFNINLINLFGQDHVGINIEAGSAAIAAANTTNYEVATHDVEDIEINLGGGNDHVEVTGSLAGTGLAYSTITIDGGGGNDTIDVSGRTSAHRVVASGGDGSDTAILGFGYADANYVEIVDTDNTTVIGVKITHLVNGVPVTDEFRGFETFEFADGSIRNLSGLFNQPPVTQPDTITVNEGGTQAVLATGATSLLANDTDADGNPLTAVLVTGPAHGTLTLNPNGTFSYTHDGSETTGDSFSYKANDGTADGNVVTVAINVNPLNDAPVAAAHAFGIGRTYGSSQNASWDSAHANYTIDLAALGVITDPNGQTLTWSSGSLPSAHWTLGSDGKLVFDSSVSAGVYDFTVSASDGAASASRAISVWVAGSLLWTNSPGNGNDTIFGSGSQDSISGGNAKDFINGAGQNDVLHGDNGNDVIYGGSNGTALDDMFSLETLYGDNGHDYLNGEAGKDTLYGGTGNDYLDGGADNDTLYGEADNDILLGGSGNDNLYGGGGADTFAFQHTGSANSDTIFDYVFAEGDKLDLSALLGDNGDASHLRAIQDGAGVRVQVDLDGAGSANAWSDVAVLSNYELANKVLVQLEHSTQQLHT